MKKVNAQIDRRLENISNKLEQALDEIRKLTAEKQQLQLENKKLKEIIARSQQSKEEDEPMSMVDMEQAINTQHSRQPEFNDLATPTNKEAKTYAEATKTHRPQITKAAKKIRIYGTQLFKGPNKKEPIKKLHVRLKDKRPLKEATSSKEVNKIIEAGLKATKLSNLVIAYSKIGNSVLELYYEDSKEEKLRARLRDEEIETIHDFEAMAPALDGQNKEATIVKRLRYLFNRYQSNRFRTAILDGYNEDITNQVRNWDPEAIKETQNIASKAPSTSDKEMSEQL